MPAGTFMKFCHQRNHLTLRRLHYQLNHRQHKLPSMRILKILCFFSCHFCGAQSDNRITIGRIDSLWSPTFKEARRILIYTPPSYSDNTFLPQKYPVIYLLDGDAHFHSVSALLQFLGTGINGNYVIPEMIVVAIPNTDRTRDLTPTRMIKTMSRKTATLLTEHRWQC